MNALWVLAMVIGVVAGDVSLGYHYKVPQTSYGIPTYQTSSTSGIYNTGLTGSTSSNNYNQYAGSGAAGTNYYSGQGAQSSSIGHNTGYQTGFASVGSTGSNTNYYQTLGSGIGQPAYQTGADYSVFNHYQTSGQHQLSSADKYQQYYNVIQQQPAQIFKHYYVHAAPEEPEASKPRQPIVLPPAQKHYKIIFIKAPSSSAQTPQIIPVQQQNEEKTIVYVLVKKPEEAQDIVLPKFEQKPPTKPEVYFIKYNNKQDSQAVINNIVNDLSKEGGSGSGYTAFSDALPGISQGSASVGQVFGQGLSLSDDHAASSASDASSLGSSGLLASTAFGSDSTLSDSSNAFGSGATGGNVFGSGSTVSSSTFGSVSDEPGNQGASTGPFGSSFNNFGSSYNGAKGQSVSIASDDSGAADSGSDFSSGFSGITSSPGISDYNSLSGSTLSSTASTLTGYDASAISTSQGVPHESYGPPKFKVL